MKLPSPKVNLIFGTVGVLLNVAAVVAFPNNPLWLPIFGASLGLLAIVLALGSILINRHEH